MSALTDKILAEHGSFAAFGSGGWRCMCGSEGTTSPGATTERLAHRSHLIEVTEAAVRAEQDRQPTFTFADRDAVRSLGEVVRIHGENIDQFAAEVADREDQFDRIGKDFAVVFERIEQQAGRLIDLHNRLCAVESVEELPALIGEMAVVTDEDRVRSIAHEVVGESVEWLRGQLIPDRLAGEGHRQVRLGDSPDNGEITKGEKRVPTFRPLQRISREEAEGLPEGSVIRRIGLRIVLERIEPVWHEPCSTTPNVLRDDHFLLLWHPDWAEQVAE